MRVLFYDDAPDFGGHELQTPTRVRYVALQPETQVGFIYFGSNARLGIESFSLPMIERAFTAAIFAAAQRVESAPPTSH